MKYKINVEVCKSIILLITAISLTACSQPNPNTVPNPEDNYSHRTTSEKSLILNNEYEHDILAPQEETNIFKNSLVVVKDVITKLFEEEVIEVTAQDISLPNNRYGTYTENTDLFPLQLPVQFAKITSLYGDRERPCPNCSADHRGLDFGLRGNPYILSAGDGEVIETQDKCENQTTGSGCYVKIKHNEEYTTNYLHLQHNTLTVKTGDRVRRGELIGLMGSSGYSTGPHLHFEIRHNNIPLNPVEYLMEVEESYLGKCVANGLTEPQSCE